MVKKVSVFIFGGDSQNDEERDLSECERNADMRARIPSR